MRVMPDGDGLGWRRVLDEQARREITQLAPRPGCPIYGLAAPSVHPVALRAAEQINGEWTQITIGYGPWDAQTGPYLRVTTAVAIPEVSSSGGMQIVSSTGMHGIDPEAELRHALAEEANRPAALPPVSGPAQAEPYREAAGAGQPASPTAASGLPAVTRERLPAGPALLVRQGTIWAARLLPAAAEAGAGGGAADEPSVVVTIVGRDVAPENVRLETLADLREAIEGRTAEVGRIIAERRRHPRPSPPPPDLEPAEGVAALRALADFILAGQADRGAARGRREPRDAPSPQPAGWGPMYGALWRRAVLEQQRVAGMDAAAADAAVTSAVNHLGHLAEQAPWFSGDERLRAAAIDETARHAMLGDAVRSNPAQRAWDGYWSSRLPGAGQPFDLAGAAHPPDPDEMRARHESLRALESTWLAAWEAWKRDA